MDKFEELKFLYNRAEKFSERRQNSSQIYLTINAVIFGALTFLAKDLGVKGKDLVLLSIPLITIGVVACFTWRNIINKLEKIIGWQYEQIREVEKKIPKSHLTINKEWKQFYEKKGDVSFSFSSLEAQLPLFLICVYIVYGSSLAIILLIP